MRSRGASVGSKTAGRGLACQPEAAHGLGLAEVVGAQLEDRLCAWLRPELLAPFDAFVDHLDYRFHGAGHDRQSLATVVVIAHSLGVVLQVAQRLENQFPRIAVDAL